MSTSQSASLAVSNDGAGSSHSASPEATVRRIWLPRSGQLLKVGSELLWFCLAWAMIVLVWELGAWQGWLNPRILPPPSETIPYLFSGEAAIGFGMQRVGLFESIVSTLLRVAVGMTAGII